MRTSLRRVLAGASALTLVSAALVLGGAAPASAAASTFCPEAASTRLLTANDGYYKVWLYQTGGEVHVCFGIADYARGHFLFRTGLSGSPVPTVTPRVNASDCATYFHLQDPLDVRIQLDLPSITAPYYLCIGAEGTAVGITVTPSPGSVDPGVELWMDHSLARQAYCYAMDRNCGYYPVRVL